MAASDQYSRDEALDLQLAVGDEPQRDRLHAAGRAGARQLAPKDRGEGEADEIIQRAAREIGVHQRAVDGARILHRLRHRLLGDGVEDDALDLLVLDRLLLFEHFKHVPGDGLAFAIRVGGENQGFGALHGLGDVSQPLGGLGVDLPDHLEVVLRIDRAVLGRQVAHMAKGSQDLVAGAEVFIDGLRLGGRLNNDNFHENTMG